MYQEFLKDNDAWSMFITGAAGTGKTTYLKEIVEYLQQEKISYAVCAYTHKACSILASKLPKGANIFTLHSVLRKRPMINDQATHYKHVEVNTQHSRPDRVKVLLIDEYSMVGEKDYMDVVAMQDPEYDEKGEEVSPFMKVIWIGDANQLPPVGDMQTIIPHGKYQLQLTVDRRTAEGNPLRDTLAELVRYIEGAPPKPLKSNTNFIRGCDIEEVFKACQGDKVFLAYTNNRVQQANTKISGKTFAESGDLVYCPTTREHYVWNCAIARKDIDEIEIPYSGKLLALETKYKTLEHLLTMDNAIIFVSLATPIGESIFACVFGHYNYKILLQYYKQEAANSNKVIEQKYNTKAKIWANANYNKALAKKRAKAWRDYLTFKECVACIDFPFAMTVHKSQGSTYENVFIDMEDLQICADKDFKMYLRLAYVAISRASKMVYTN